ncbi:hypothetical protein KCV87_23680 [Actinosynnema pretiosum subsp. pretiosum]|uniref:Uncharacterized protein n=2 Tax=Actinosynnema TaxID=40566 RepID=C6WKK9_ACTMD|nr:YrhB domain-containing protein [Actinosynnema mirum]ACU40260.1 hypothetical protein Amir_6459 [Actinosynnema mirum DSM 43827]QUF02461.1 hypothetical protein KCV87_23680 [Actinosynnema pretiosum subsp. pretiosum]
MTQARSTAERWLDHVYGGAVEPSGDALLVTPAYTVFGCRYTGSDEPMLAAALAVPGDGGQPFPLPNDDPFSVLDLVDGQPVARALTDPADWVWRLNARGSVVAVDALVDRRPASVVPWRPEHELPGWWDRLRAWHFPHAEVSAVPDWEAAVAALRDGGEDTRGVVWVRRELAGTEVTGHLLYAHHGPDGVVVLDGMRGGPADLEVVAVKELVLARFHRPRPPVELLGFEAAVRRAEEHLAQAYGAGEVVLVDPSPEDELSRGWLFACTTVAYRDSDDLRYQMLDAALVVPKESDRAPFALPNADPWPWLERWDAGDAAGLDAPPAPSHAAWIGHTAAELGQVTGVSTHLGWAGVFGEFAGMEVGRTALVWVRRRDRRGRETVGHLLNGRRAEGGVQLADGTRPEPPVLTDEGLLGLHVIHYR